MKRLPNDVEFLNKIILAMENSFGIWKDILPSNLDELKKYFKELVEYKKLEDQGLLIKLPCKVGDIVYCIEDTGTKKKPRSEIIEYIVDRYYIGEQLGIEICSKQEGLEAFADIYTIGKSIFLTREEAEKVLEVEV